MICGRLSLVYPTEGALIRESHVRRVGGVGNATGVGGAGLPTLAKLDGMVCGARIVLVCGGLAVSGGRGVAEAFAR